MYFWRVVGEVINKSDIVLLVGDSRLPEQSTNEKLESMIRRDGKELVYVFNRIDLLSPLRLQSLRNSYPDAFFVSAKENEGIGKLRLHLKILGKRLKRDEPKIGVVGYPNVGKSAIINALAHRAKARVSNKPGTTRGIQWVKAGGLRILDSPGVIPLEDRENKLALIGSKQPEKLEQPDKLAIEIIKMMLVQERKMFQERYGLTDKELTEHPYDIMLLIGKKRGFLGKGGIVDEYKTAVMIIREWQKGKIKV